MKLEDFFSQVYLVNLDIRQDRLQRITPRLQAQNLSFERFPAIIPQDKGGYYLLGMLGCLMSHLEVIRKAIKDNQKNILIFEDDCVLRDDFRAILEPILNQMNDIEWDLFFVGASWQDAQKKEKITDNLYSLDKVLHTHAYAINCKSFIKIEANLEKASKVLKDGIPIDQLYSKLPYKKIAIVPNLAVQEPDKSNIERNYTNRLNEYNEIDLFAANCKEFESLGKVKKKEKRK